MSHPETELNYITPDQMSRPETELSYITPDQMSRPEAELNNITQMTSVSISYHQSNYKYTDNQGYAVSKLPQLKDAEVEEEHVLQLKYHLI